MAEVHEVYEDTASGLDRAADRLWSILESVVAMIEDKRRAEQHVILAPNCGPQYERERAQNRVFWRHRLKVPIFKVMMCRTEKCFKWQLMLCIWIVKDLNFLRPILLVCFVANVDLKCFAHHSVRVGIVSKARAEITVPFGGEPRNYTHSVKFRNGASIREEYRGHIFCPFKIEKT